MEAGLNSMLHVDFVWIVELIEIATFYRNDWFIMREPLLTFVPNNSKQVLAKRRKPQLSHDLTNRLFPARPSAYQNDTS